MRTILKTLLALASIAALVYLVYLDTQIVAKTRPHVFAIGQK